MTRNEQIYRLCIEAKPYEEIARSFDITRERVRQIFYKEIRHRSKSNPLASELNERIETGQPIKQWLKDQAKRNGKRI